MKPRMLRKIPPSRNSIQMFEANCTAGNMRAAEPEERVRLRVLDRVADLVRADRCRRDRDPAEHRLGERCTDRLRGS